MYEDLKGEFRQSIWLLVNEFKDRDLANIDPMTDDEFWDRAGDIHVKALAEKSRIKREAAGSRCAKHPAFEPNNCPGCGTQAKI